MFIAYPESFLSVFKNVKAVYGFTFLNKSKILAHILAQGYNIEQVFVYLNLICN